MLKVEGLLAAFAWLVVGSFVIASFTPEDKRDGGLLLLLAAVDFGGALYSDVPAVALALQVLLALQALAAVLWFMRLKSLR
jgi:hypothetical protein